MARCRSWKCQSPSPVPHYVYSHSWLNCQWREWLRIYLVYYPRELAATNIYILVIVDYFTTWKEAHAIRNMEAATIARCFVNEFVCCFRVPKQLHSDQGRNLESLLIKEIRKMLGTVKIWTTSYHLQSDSVIGEQYLTCWAHVQLSQRMKKIGICTSLYTQMLAYCQGWDELFFTYCCG